MDDAAISEVADRLMSVAGVVGVVLGGSRARGTPPDPGRGGAGRP